MKVEYSAWIDDYVARFKHPAATLGRCQKAVEEMKDVFPELEVKKGYALCDEGFAWSEIDPNWKNWTYGEYLDALDSVQAHRGYHLDMDAMEWADVGVLVLGAGASAHLELGWFAGNPNKRSIILLAPEYDDDAAKEYLKMQRHSLSHQLCSPCGDPDRCWLGTSPMQKERRMEAVRHRPFEPELMYKMADFICFSAEDVLATLVNFKDIQ